MYNQTITIMKQILIIAAILATPLAASAQPHVIDAYEALRAHHCSTAQRISNSYDNGKQNGLLEIYEFATANAAETALVTDLIEAFETDSSRAYSYVYHKAGEPRQRYSVYYDPANAEVIGANRSYNYMLLNIMDKDDASETMRYSYVLEWQRQNDDTMSGRIIKAYAPKPASASRRSYAVRVGDKDRSKDDIDKLTARRVKATRIVKGPIDSILVDLLDTLPDHIEALVDLDRLGSHLSLSLDTLGGSLSNGLAQFGNALKHLDDLVGSDNGPELTDDVEWLTSFNHYRNAFKRAAAGNRSSVASYATSILKLCKNSQKASLTDGELNLCRKSIKELQKLTDDDFVKGLLDEACKYLK